MNRNWQKFTLDELLYIWKGHKEEVSNPLNLRGEMLAKRIEITNEDLENLVDYLLLKILTLRNTIEGKY